MTDKLIRHLYSFASALFSPASRQSRQNLRFVTAEIDSFAVILRACPRAQRRKQSGPERSEELVPERSEGNLRSFVSLRTTYVGFFPFVSLRVRMTSYSQLSLILAKITKVAQKYKCHTELLREARCCDYQVAATFRLCERSCPDA